MAIKKWMHISEMGGDSWVLPIYASLNDYAGRKGVAKPPQNFYNLGLHISIKLNMLPKIIDRIAKGYKTLVNLVRRAGDDYVCSESKSGYALDVDNEQKYQLLIDIDSFFFEFNSCKELMLEFLFRVHSYTGKKVSSKKKGEEFKIVIGKNKIKNKWVTKLASHRNFFIHEGAPYIAFDMTKAPQKYELLIMKENIKDFKNENKFIRLSELNDISHGFLYSAVVLQGYLKKYLKAL